MKSEREHKKEERELKRILLQLNCPYRVQEVFRHLLDSGMNKTDAQNELKALYQKAYVSSREEIDTYLIVGALGVGLTLIALLVAYVGNDSLTSFAKFSPLSALLSFWSFYQALSKSKRLTKNKSAFEKFIDSHQTLNQADGR